MRYVTNALALAARCALCLVIGGLASLEAGAAMYRWVDAQGKVQYSDHPPPEAGRSGHIEMDAQGRVTKRVKALPTTPEGRKQLELETARQAAQEREAQEQRRRDSALLSTYRNIAELDKAKQRALELEQSLLVSLRTSRNAAAAGRDRGSSGSRGVFLAAHRRVSSRGRGRRAGSPGRPVPPPSISSICRSTSWRSPARGSGRS
jgi:hypothetical protein